MIKLTKATIHKYKCIENPQSFDVESDITVLVGMNESGKTSILEALAKVNYFEEDVNFKFNPTHDYPRKQKKVIDKSGEDPDAVTLHFVISDALASRIASDTGVSFSSRTFSITKTYGSERTWNVNWVSSASFATKQSKTIGIQEKTLLDALSSITKSSKIDFDSYIKSLTSMSTEEIDKLKTTKNTLLTRGTGTK